jgi:hypothetical protein
MSVFQEWLPTVIDELKEVIRSLIYHGRHFSPSRDDVVARKSLIRLLQIIVKANEEG